MSSCPHSVTKTGSSQRSGGSRDGDRDGLDGEGRCFDFTSLDYLLCLEIEGVKCSAMIRSEDERSS